ncbi:MAG: peptide chain release factor N(5)-glutamine methyltransferase [Clostridiales bacterium]|nr:peptide chain release factor N(5)-glutamine methyltransferase [Clostridiales bacterium]
MTLEELYQEGIHKLEASKIAEARLDAWYLLESITGVSRGLYILHRSDVMEPETVDAYQSLIAKRAERIPLQYILGEQEFMGISFLVNEHVLIPRQDTEILVEQVLKAAKELPYAPDVLDMCTGSGCILISIASLTRVNQAVGADCSKEALDVAKKNGQRSHVEAMWLESNLFENVTGTYDILTSNPPYIPTSVIGTLEPEVKDHEPLLALDGTEDGLAFYRLIGKQAGSYLKPGGQIFLEIGCEQAADVCRILQENEYLDIQVTKDYSGLDRVVSARKKS